MINIDQNVLFEAVKAYLGVIRETENVSLRDGNLSVISEELRAANDRFEVGEITKTDVALAEARLAASNSALAFAKGSFEQAIAGYITAIGRKPNVLEYPSFIPEVPNSLENAIAIALAEHPLIDELKNLRNLIDNIDEFHHKKIFEIIKKYNMNYSKNKNGIFINMNNLSKSVLDELNNYLLYINKQEKTFSDIEKIKNEFKKEFFNKIEENVIVKENKDMANNSINNE